MSVNTLGGVGGLSGGHKASARMDAPAGEVKGSSQDPPVGQTLRRRAGPLQLYCLHLFLASLLQNAQPCAKCLASLSLHYFICKMGESNMLSTARCAEEEKREPVSSAGNILGAP